MLVKRVEPHPHCVGRLFGELASQLRNPGIELVVRHDLRQQADLLCLRRGDLFAEQHELQQLPSRNEPLKDRHDHHREQTALDLRCSQDRAFAGDGEVTAGDDPHRAPHDVSGDARDDGLLERIESQQQVVELALLFELAPVRGHALQIAPRAESVPGPRQDDHPHIVRGFRVIERPEELVDHLLTQRVLLFRLVEGQSDDVAVLPHEQGLIVALLHGGILGPGFCQFKRNDSACNVARLQPFQPPCTVRRYTAGGAE